jgi:hypothetical protein
MAYRNDLDAAHARIEAVERENRALETELERLRMPTLAEPMCMEPVRRAPVDLGDLLGAARIVVFLFILLYTLVLGFAR